MNNIGIFSALFNGNLFFLSDQLLFLTTLVHSNGTVKLFSPRTFLTNPESDQ